MFKALSSLLRVCLYTLGLSLASNQISTAQVTSDDTVNTQVTQNGNVAEITGGETRGSNLFHSFQDFSVTTDSIADFQNADNISDIFSRVTGGNISNIDGMIRANGSANLFLINPNGIIFGEGASLNIGGSFYGSSANSILFDEGEFSATNLNNPVLTINAPIGLGFRDSPGDLVNNSVANDGVGLSVSAGNNLTLLGGNVSFDQGNIIAPDATVNLGGLSAAGVIEINDNGSLSLTTDVERADVTLNNSSIVDVQGIGNGNININARNLELTAGTSGELGFSVIAAGVVIDSNNTEVGNITINATDNIAVDDSLISNPVAPGVVGNAGDITITANSLSLTNGGQVIASTSTFGQGNAGSIEIIASDTISIDGESDDFPSGIGSSVQPGAVGDAGGVSITANSLSKSS